MAVHQAGMVEPMMMMGMVDNASGVKYSTNRQQFPPHAHTGVPSTTISSHITTQMQTKQTVTDTVIISQLQQQQPQPVQPSSIESSVSDTPTPVTKPKKPRKKKSDDRSAARKSHIEVKLKKKKNNKDRAKSKPKKPAPAVTGSEGTVSLLGKKGKTLDAQAREIALNVAEYFKREAELGRTLMPLHSYQKRAAAATGVSTATLRKLEGARRELKSERVAAEGMVEDPFPNLAIDDTTFLDITESRHKCKKCLKSRKFFCYTCCTPNPQIQDKLPKVKLPVKIDIIKHQSESDGKSTCPHALILAPDDVTVYTYPCIPDYDKEKVVLVFPCKDARTLRDMAFTSISSTSSSILVPPATTTTCSTDVDPINTMISTTTDSGLHTPRPEQVNTAGGYTDITTSSTYADLQTIWTNAYFPQPGPSTNVQPSGTYTYLQAMPLYPSQDFSNSGKRMAESQDQEEQEDTKRMRVTTPPFERAIFIDCTWNQTKNIISDERLKDLRRVEMRGYETQFWRCQEGLPTSCLSTIEAIYYFMREYHEDILDSTYMNEYDNLLFFFIYFYRKIREKYQGGKDLKAYQRKMIDDDAQEIV